MSTPSTISFIHYNPVTRDVAMDNRRRNEKMTVPQFIAALFDKSDRLYAIMIDSSKTYGFDSPEYADAYDAWYKASRLARDVSNETYLV